MPYGRFDIDVKAAFKPLGIKLNSKTSRVDDETLIRMVGRGLGVSIMSVLAAREYLLAGRLLSFELGSQGAFRKIYLCWRKDALLSPAEQKFLEFVQARPMIVAGK